MTDTGFPLPGAAPTSSPTPPGASIRPDPLDELDEWDQVLLGLRAQTPRSWGEAWRDLREGGILPHLPVLGGASVGVEGAEARDHAKRIEEGTAGLRDYLWAVDQTRSSGTAAMALDIAGQIPGFAGDIITSGGISALLKGGAKAATKGLAGKAVAGMAATPQAAAGLKAAKVAGSAATRGASLAAVQEGIPQLLSEDGGRMSAAAFQRSIGLDVGLTEEGAVAIQSTVRPFAEAWPEGVLDVLIEDVSEFSGGVLTKMVGLEALQGAVTRWWLKKTGGTADDLVSQIGKAGAWHNIVGEYLEEVAGGQMRAGTEILPEGLQLEEAGDYLKQFPNMQETVAMLGAFAVFPAAGAGLRGVGKLASKGAGGADPAAPDAPEEGPAPELLGGGAAEPEGLVEYANRTAPEGVVPPEDVGAPEAVPGVEAAQEAPAEVPAPAPDVDQAAPDPEGGRNEQRGPLEGEGAAPPQDTGQDTTLAQVAAGEGRDVAELTEAEPETPEHRAAVERGREVGLVVRFVRGMRSGGAFVRSGEVVINPDAPNPARSYLVHEAVHNVVRAIGGAGGRGFESLYRTLLQHDRAGIKKARRRHRRAWVSDYMAAHKVNGETAERAYRAAHPKDLQREESLATYAQEVVGYLELLASPDGAAHVNKLIRENPGLWEKIVEAFRKMVARVRGQEFQGREARLLRQVDEIGRELGGGAATVDGAKGAKFLRAALELAAGREGGEGSVRFAGPRAEAEEQAPDRGPRFAPAERPAPKEPATAEDVDRAMRATKRDLSPRKRSKAARRRADIIERFGALDEPRLVDVVLERFQDRHRRIRQFVAALADAGGLVTEGTDMSGALDRLPGRVTHRLRAFTATHVTPLLTLLRSKGISQKEAGEYLEVRHAPERNAWGVSKDPDGGWSDEEKPFSGISTSAAKARRAEFEKRDGFKEIGERIDAMNAETRDTLLAGGLISQAQYDAWVAMFQHYVPLRDDADPELPPDPRSKGFQVRGPESRSAKGRSRRVEARSPLIFSVSQGHSAIIRGETNQIGTRFAALLRENEGLATFEPVERPEGGEEFQIPEDSFTFKENGEEVIIRLSDEALASALKDLASIHPNAFIRVLAKLNRYLAAVNTALNPDFILTNLNRDLMTAAISLPGDVEGGAAGLVARVVASVVNPAQGFPAIRAAIKGELGGEPTSEWDRSYQEFVENGGATGYYYQPPYEVLSKQLQKDIDRGALGSAVTGSLEYLRNVSGGFENATRLSVFHHLRKAGVSAERAAVAAKNVTVNFNTRGSWGTVFNSFYLFGNAGVQGSRRVLTSLRSRKVQVMAANLVAAGYLQDLMMRAMAGDDDDDGRNHYDKIPEFEKSRNLIFMGEGGRYWKLPLPYGFNVFHNIGRHLSAVSAGAETPGAAVGGILQATVDSFNPLGSGGFLQTVTPTFLDPFMDIGLNKNFAGSPIAKPHRGFGPEPPASRQHFRSVSSVSKTVATALSEWTGGDPHTPGWLEVNPEHIDHFYEFFAGGIGRFVERSAKSVFREPGVPLDPNDVPILRRFVSSIPPWQAEGDFWGALDKIETARLRIRDGFTRPGDEALVALRDGVVIKGGRKTSLVEEIRELREQEDAASGAESKKLYDARIRVMKRFLRRYYSALKPPDAGPDSRPPRGRGSSR